MKKFLLSGLFCAVFLFCFAAAASAETTEDGLLTYTVTDGSVTITGITDSAYEGELTLPDTIGSMPVTCVTGGFFESLDGYVTTLTLPAGLETIDGDNLGQTCIVEAFAIDTDNPYFSTDEEGVLFNKDKTVLYKYPMVGPCKEYTVPETVTTLYGCAFANLNELEYVRIPSGVEAIPNMCFVFSHSLKTIELAEGVRTIGNNAIAECRNMEHVILPATLERIDSCGISGCHKMKELVIPASVKGIYGSWAIGDNKALEKVVFLGEPEIIYNACLKGNSSLAEVWFAGSRAEWDGNTYLSELNLYGAELRCGYVCTPGLKLESDGVLLYLDAEGELPAVNEGGFADWSEYSSSCGAVRIGENVTRIGSGTFAGFSSLSEAVLSGADVTVTAGAFTGCDDLVSIVTVGSAVFENDSLPADTVVYAPADREVVYSGRIVRFSYAEEVLTFNGEIETDPYTFLDIISVLCARYGTVNKIKVSSLYIEGMDFYYFDENGIRRRLPDDTLTNGEITVGAETPDGDISLTFNELCAGIADGTLTGFYFSTSTETYGDNIDTQVDISFAERVTGGIRRVLKAIVTLLNRLFRLLKALR